MHTLLFALAAFLISLVLTPVVRRLAVRLNVFASRNHRTIHTRQIPKLGGLSIFLAFLAGLLMLWLVDSSSDYFTGLLLGGTFVMVLGLLDDLYNLSCYRKLVGEILAASLVVWSGLSIEHLYLPFGLSVDLGMWAAPLTVVWIVGLTNAINLLDGLDGLAAGFSGIVALFLVIVGLLVQDVQMASLALILLAACLGFLRYNLNPAKIFMGDMGSLFLGFVLACLSLRIFTVPNEGLHSLALYVLFAIPIVDTSLAVMRRVKARQHPFSGDRKHIHHRLLDLGLNQGSAVLTIYTIAFLCGISALFMMIWDSTRSLLLLFSFNAMFLLWLSLIGCFDFLQKKLWLGEVGGIRIKQRRNGKV